MIAIYRCADAVLSADLGRFGLPTTHGQFIEVNRVADNFPAQFLAHLPQFADLTMPENDDVVGRERDDKILTIATDGDLLAKRHGGLPEGFNDIKC